MFVNKDIERKNLEILINKLISKGNEKYSKIAPWGKVEVNTNKDARGNVDDNNFLYWKFFLDIAPIENIHTDEYINGIKKLMHDLRINGFQVIAACDFEDELPKYDNKDFELAYRIYPEPDGTTYYKSDLMEEKNVEILFDYCQILEAIIYKVGWEFLIDFHGYEKLFDINKRSGWFDAEEVDEFIQYVEMDMAYSEGEGD